MAFDAGRLTRSVLPPIAPLDQRSDWIIGFLTILWLFPGVVLRCAPKPPSLLRFANALPNGAAKAPSLLLFSGVLFMTPCLSLVARVFFEYAAETPCLIAQHRSAFGRNHRPFARTIRLP